MADDTAEDTEAHIRAPKKRSKVDPCTNCRERHLKCDSERPVCTRCERNGDDCVRGGTKIKFRHGSSARYDSGFSKDQTWLRTAGNAKHLEYVDETEDVKAYYADGGGGADSDTASNADTHDARKDLHIRTSSFVSVNNGSKVPYSPNLDYHTLPNPPAARQTIPRSTDVFQSPLKRRKTNDSEPMDFVRRTTSNSYGNDDAQSLPDQSPAFSFLNLQSPTEPQRRPMSAHGNMSNFDYASYLGLSGISPGTGSGMTPFSHNSVGPDASTARSPVDPSFAASVSFDPSLEKGANTSIREAVLMRYFVEDLAPWFDLCDPERHFALVVPHRARHCPPLLNAIYTASARHLTRLRKFKTPMGVQWHKYFLSDLNTETAIQYHNECISNLIELSMDPDQMHNENLLAAASILRWHEEVDAPFRDSGTDDLFLKVINTFVNAQAPATPALPHSLPQLMSAAQRHDSLTSHKTDTSSSSVDSSSDPRPRHVRADGLRQAAFWVAFRQSIYTSFIKQVPVNFPLERCRAFRTFEPAEDAVWADRLIIFCADVLQYCHGSEKSTREKWEELSHAEKKWSQVLPSSFEPIYYRPPDRARGEVFPEIWYLSDCHVAGVQHVELARILLTVYDPTMPRLGPGHVAALNAMSTALKRIVLRLCGIALSNRKTPPGLVTACMGIAMCGEHFADRGEQEALIGVLEELETEHGWPTEDTVGMLKKSWGWVA